MLKEKFKFLKGYFSSWTRLQIWLGIIFVVVLIAGGTSAFYNSRYYKSSTANDEIDLIEADQNGDINNDVVAPTNLSDPSSSTSIPKSSSTQNPSKSSNTSSGAGTNGSTGGTSPETLASPESLSATVAFYADSQTNDSTDEQVHQRAVNYILGTSANPVFHAGDLMEDGTQASLDSFNAVTATLRSSRSFYAALGNNDRNGGDTTTPSPLFLNNFVFPNNEKWYSVNVGNLHMVVLDSAFAYQNSGQAASQRAWLESDLQSEASRSRITGVMFHHPGSPSTLASSISQLLVDNNVDFVVEGHIHSYGHSASGGVHYFTLSGQQSIGYLLAKVYSSTISISAYNSSNSLIETINIPNR